MHVILRMKVKMLNLCNIYMCLNEQVTLCVMETEAKKYESVSAWPYCIT